MAATEERQKFCNSLAEAIADEGVASNDYENMENTLEASDNPAIRALGLSVEMIKKDERKHRDTLEHIVRVVCATRL